MKTLSRHMTIALFAAGMSSGCSNVNMPNSLGDLTSGDKTRANVETVGTLPPPPSRTWPSLTDDLNSNRADGWGLVSMPEMERYLNGLLAKIKTTAGVPDWPGSVHITADTSLSAASTAAGNIYVSVYWIQVAESEDEIFALLSHEFGHVYLNHYAAYDVKTAGETAAEVTSIAWSYANKRASATSWTGVDNIFVVESLGTRALFPAWQRSIEEQADRFGATISLKCGYSYPDGFKTFLERIGTYDQQAKQRQQKLKEMQTAADREKIRQNPGQQSLPAVPGTTSAQLQSLSALQSALSSATGTPIDIKTSAAETTFDVTHSLEDNIGVAAEALQETHGDAAEREADLRKQVMPLIGNSSPDARTEPWIKARKQGATPTILAHYALIPDVQTLEAQKRYGEAAATAEKAASGPTANDGMPLFMLANLSALSGASRQDATIQTLRRNLNARERSWQVQVNLASRMATKDRRQAEAFLQQQFEYFGEAAPTWPSIIAFYRDGGDSERAKNMALTCSAKYPAYRTACVAASQKPSKSDDSGFKHIEAVGKGFFEKLLK